MSKDVIGTAVADLVQPVPFGSGRWRWQAAESRVEEHLGRESLYLRSGIATVADLRFANGWIEFDLACSGERAFLGGVWRVADARNYEEFYVRPHQSGNPDATQYTPVFNGVSGWQLYHGPRYAVPAVHRCDSWMHVKVLFSGTRAEIYLDGREEPALFVPELKRGVAPGGVGVSAGSGAGAHFSHFAFAVTDSPPIQGRPVAPEPVPEGIIPAWWVSDAFRESALLGRDALGADDLAARRFTRLATERLGLANLARVQGIELGKNTVFVRTAFHSLSAQTKRLDFGWSDRVRVFLNGRLLFQGDDTYRSRDYRFLGSIGYFDTLYLALATGRNELLIAVSEDQGGWGVQAKLADLAGITFED
jgi:hypothetical protein